MNSKKEMLRNHIFVYFNDVRMYVDKTVLFNLLVFVIFSFYKVIIYYSREINWQYIWRSFKV